MTTRFFNTLSIRRARSELRVEGVGALTSTQTRGHATIQLESATDKSFAVSIEFHLLDSITSDTPVAHIATSCWQHLRSLSLADPTFGSPGRIDALIGADVWGTILREGIVRGAPAEPFAQSTHLGWVIFGPATIDVAVPATMQSLQVHITDTDQRLDDLLQQFWNLEETMISPVSPPEADICEQIFLATHKRLADGRYCVQIPFRPDAQALGNSHQLALRQFHQLERRLSSNAELRHKYIDFMREYIGLGHMNIVSDQPGDPSQCYYIPHHAVTAKFRVVFNASAKTSNGVSLNDTQLAGPTIQPLLINIIFRFRRYAVALSADIEKMFRQVHVDERHHQWQQILWRESPSEPLRTYRLSTVTYGMASGPYNAVRAMQQCGIDNCDIIKNGIRAAAARESILNDFYVDDYLASCPSTERAVELAKDVDRILLQGRFPLRKWQSNDSSSLAQITNVATTTDDLEFKTQRRPFLAYTGIP